MLYAILCYSDEATARSLDKKRDDELMSTLQVVHDALIAEGTLGPSFRLMATGHAKTVRSAAADVLDGPFAETKEQLLGLHLVECASMDEAVAPAHRLQVRRKAPRIGGPLAGRPHDQYFRGNRRG